LAKITPTILHKQSENRQVTSHDPPFTNKDILKSGKITNSFAPSTITPYIAALFCR